MKKTNFIKEIRQNSIKELLKQRQSLNSQNLKLRMDINFNRSSNSVQLKHNRVKIAQINTIVNENIYSAKENYGK